MAQILKFSYQLRHHRFGGWPLDRWAVTAAWSAAVVVLLQWLLRDRPASPLWHWLVLALLALGGAGLLALRIWAARRNYTVFTPEDGKAGPAPCALLSDDKVALWATGRFEVEGKAGSFAYLQAFWRTFVTCEHAIMAIQHPSRYLLLGRTPVEQIGMWYIFIPAQAVEQVTPGRGAFGASCGPALRVTYRREADQSARRPAKSVHETIYLLFEDEPARERVWADLLRR